MTLAAVCRVRGPRQRSMVPPRGRGSVGRAPPCQGGGRGFESRRPLRIDAGEAAYWPPQSSRRPGPMGNPNGNPVHASAALDLPAERRELLVVVTREQVAVSVHRRADRAVTEPVLYLVCPPPVGDEHAGVVCRRSWNRNPAGRSHSATAGEKCRRTKFRCRTGSPSAEVKTYPVLGYAARCSESTSATSGSTGTSTSWKTTPTLERS